MMKLETEELEKTSELLLSERVVENFLGVWFTKGNHSSYRFKKKIVLPLSIVLTWFKTFFFSWGVIPSILPRNVKKIWIKFQNTNTQFDGLTAMIQFAINYNVSWIIRWEYGLQDLTKEKFEIKFAPTVLIRKILIKWWGKKDFFAEGEVYDRQGVIVLGVARETMKNLNHDTPIQTTLLKEL